MVKSEDNIKILKNPPNWGNFFFSSQKITKVVNPYPASPNINPNKSGNVKNKDEFGFNDYHLEPNHKTGRGAGGHCFIKDFEAFLNMYEAEVGDSEGNNVLEALRKKNIQLLVESSKDLNLLKEVYGDLLLEKFS